MSGSLKLLERGLAVIAVGAVLAMMLLVSLDVIARYLFKAPLTFQYSLTEDYLMVIMVALALPWAERRGAFIRLTPFHRLMSPGVRRGLYALNNLIIALMLLAMTWYAGERVWVDWWEQRVIFGVIDWPVWLSHVWVPIGTLVLSLRLFTNACLYLLGKAEVPSPPSLDEMGEGEEALR
ncbi:TRAP transporter small permease [Alcanivorax sp. 24]|uniref:TRAP transporter small permease n=1 Tax=Alcanivorax sp. 24 TaxID=2545266 RepID=UPI00141525D3|nr:TRAP transporter small permease [Alcanivorax sp. 24]